ncbi:MAG: 3-deoxy-7-phosphoheptulonate synthase [Candidatus Methylomirabilales bacterium]
MIIVMQAGASEEQLQEVLRRVEEVGYHSHLIRGTHRNVVGAVGDERGKARLQSLEALPGVESVVPILQPFKLASREFRRQKTVIKVGEVEIGAERLALMAGPCSVESEAQLLEAARAVKAAGATILRGGAFKPRTSPYSFQGLGEEGLKLLALAREATGLKIVTEVLNDRDVELVARYADILQVGARNMQNFALLNLVGEARKPVLLKRGMSATVKDLLMAAEYILSHENYDVILCERGIRTFETATRFTLDLNAVPVLQKLTHLPVIVDPSHGTGYAEYVTAMARAAVAAGADGLIVEVHPKPEEALSDGVQSLTPPRFEELMRQLAPVARAVGRSL